MNEHDEPFYPSYPEPTKLEEEWRRRHEEAQARERSYVARHNTLTTDEAITLLCWAENCLSEIEKKRLTAFAVWLDRHQPNRPYGPQVLARWSESVFGL